jgi:hypothetical protein
MEKYRRLLPSFAKGADVRVSNAFHSRKQLLMILPLRRNKIHQQKHKRKGKKQEFQTSNSESYHAFGSEKKEKTALIHLQKKKCVEIRNHIQTG